jgi:hypothetical protein
MASPFLLGKIDYQEFLSYFGVNGTFDDADSFETVTQKAYKP